MEIYKAKKFDIPELEGISEKQVEEHLKLYEGYVKHTNLILSKLSEWKEGPKDNSYIISELQRRLGFEFDGMRSHEFYFGQLEGGKKAMDEEGPFAKALQKEFGSLKDAHEEFVSLAKTRGVGWAIIYWDKEYERLQYAWIDEHHFGHLSSLDIVFAVDMWEHAFLVDYLPSEKGKYIESYLKNVNWEFVEENFKKALS